MSVAIVNMHEIGRYVVDVQPELHVPRPLLLAKEMVNAAFEIPLGQGIRFERRLFHGLFGTEDQKEGMAAFVEKRPGNWKGR